MEPAVIRNLFPPPVRAVEIPKKAGGENNRAILSGRFLWLQTSKISNSGYWSHKETLLEIRMGSGV